MLLRRCYLDIAYLLFLCAVILCYRDIGLSFSGSVFGFFLATLVVSMRCNIGVHFGSDISFSLLSYIWFMLTGSIHCDNDVLFNGEIYYGFGFSFWLLTLSLLLHFGVPCLWHNSLLSFFFIFLVFFFPFFLLLFFFYSLPYELIVTTAILYASLWLLFFGLIFWFLLCTLHPLLMIPTTTHCSNDNLSGVKVFSVGYIYLLPVKEKHLLYLFLLV